MRVTPLEQAMHKLVSEAIDHYYKFTVLNNCPIRGCGVCRAVSEFESRVGTDELRHYLYLVSRIKNGVLLIS